MRDEQPRGGQLFVLSGPSGVGKDAAIARLKETGLRIYHVITATSRARRPYERDGVDYFFHSFDEFKEMRNRGELLESAIVHGNLYGTPRQQVRERLALGHDVLLKIDVQGARQVKARVPDAVFIFLAPPSVHDLVERLLRRDTETEEQRSIRVQNAYIEMEAVESYDYMVINWQDRLDEAVSQIRSIIEAEHCRVKRRIAAV